MNVKRLIEATLVLMFWAVLMSGCSGIYISEGRSGVMEM